MLNPRLQGRLETLARQADDPLTLSLAEILVTVAIFTAVIIALLLVCIWMKFRYPLRNVMVYGPAHHVPLTFDERAAAASSVERSMRAAAAASASDWAAALSDAPKLEPDAVCSVCLDRLYGSVDDKKTGDAKGRRVMAPRCGHGMHLECWDMWLSKDATRSCPVCRKCVQQTDPAVKVEIEGD